MHEVCTRCLSVWTRFSKICSEWRLVQFQHHLHSKWTKHKAMKLVLDSMEQSTNQFCIVIDAFCTTKHKYQLMTNAQEPWGCFPWISLLSYFSQLARAAPTRTVITTILILRQCTFLVPSDLDSATYNLTNGETETMYLSCPLGPKYSIGYRDGKILLSNQNQKKGWVMLKVRFNWIYIIVN